MIFGRHINRYYARYAAWLLLGLAALVTVDYLQLLIPNLYQMVVNGINDGHVTLNGETVPFTAAFVLQQVCAPMVWIVLAIVFGRFLWRIMFFGSAIRMEADLRQCQNAQPGILPNPQSGGHDEPVYQRPGYGAGMFCLGHYDVF